MLLGANVSCASILFSTEGRALFSEQMHSVHKTAYGSSHESGVERYQSEGILQ